MAEAERLNVRMAEAALRCGAHGMGSDGPELEARYFIIGLKIGFVQQNKLWCLYNYIS